MKTINSKNITCALLFLTLVSASSTTLANGKQKPPVAERAVVEISWYQPVLDFFNF